MLANFSLLNLVVTLVTGLAVAAIGVLTIWALVLSIRALRKYLKS